MTTRTATRMATADASVLSSVRGWPSWAVILLALVLTLGGTAVDGLTTGVLAWGFRIGFYLGVILAALAVRRGSIFTAMVQPPLVCVFGLVVGGMLFTDAGGLYGTALRIIGTFPTMAIGTAAAVLIGLIRILAQPVRSASAGTRPASHA
ncbi:MAG: DUF6542 domain-containing protein [Nakamurella sp.]